MVSLPVCAVCVEYGAATLVTTLRAGFADQAACLPACLVRHRLALVAVPSWRCMHRDSRIALTCTATVHACYVGSTGVVGWRPCSALRCAVVPGHTMHDARCRGVLCAGRHVRSAGADSAHPHTSACVVAAPCCTCACTSPPTASMHACADPSQSRGPHHIMTRHHAVSCSPGVPTE